MRGSPLVGGPRIVHHGQWDDAARDIAPGGQALVGRHSAPRPDPDDVPPAAAGRPEADAPRDRGRALRPDGARRDVQTTAVWPAVSPPDTVRPTAVRPSVVRPTVVWPTTSPTPVQPAAAEPVAATPASSRPATGRTDTTRPEGTPTPPAPLTPPPDEEPEDSPRVAGALRTWVERGLMAVLAALTGLGVALWVGVGRTTAVVVAAGLLVLVPVAAWIAASVPGPDHPEN